MSTDVDLSHIPANRSGRGRGRVAAIAAAVMVLGLAGILPAQPAHAAVLPPVDVVVGSAVSISTVDVTGLLAPVSLSISGALPAGLTFDQGDAVTPGTGAITGTPTEAAPAMTVTVTAIDGAAAPVTREASVTITVSGLLAASTPVSTATVSPAATPSLSLTPTGLVGPVTYAASPGLPAGLSFSPDGLLIGSATSPLPLASYSITATDSRGATAQTSVGLRVDGGVLPASAASLVGQVGLPVTGVSFGSASWTGVTYVVGPTIPPGFLIDATGALVWTPSVAQSSSIFTVEARDSIGPIATATLSITAASVTPAMTTLTGNVGAPVVATSPLTAAGFAAGVKFTGALPAGLAINELTGVVSGTPTGIVSGSFVITATDSAGASATSTLNVTIAATQLTPPVLYFVQAGSVAGSLRAYFAAPSNAPVGQSYAAEVYDATGGALLMTIRPMTALTEITGLTTGESYQVVIVADASSGYLASRSAPVSGTASLTGARMVAPVITAVAPGNVPGALKVTFTKSTNAPAGQTYTARVYDEGRVTLVKTMTAVVSPVTITGLTPGDVYFVTVAADASPGYLEAVSRPGSGVAAPSTVTGTAASGALTPVNVAQAATAKVAPLRLTAGFFLIAGKQADSAKRVIVVRSRALTPAKAPTIRVPRNKAVVLRIGGLPASVPVLAQVRIKSRWADLGTARSTGKGVVELPAFRVTKVGTFVLRLTSIGSQQTYLKIALKGARGAA